MIRIGETAARSAGQIVLKLASAVSARPKATLRRFWRDERGATILEFGLMALPFFAMILGTMSLGLYYFYNASVDLGVYGAARQILNGQLQQHPGYFDNPGDFATNVLCPNMPKFVPCSATNPVVTITVVPAGGFNNIHNLTNTYQMPGPPPYWVTTIAPQTGGLCAPQQGEIIYIQAVYNVPFLDAVYTVFPAQIIAGTTVKVEEIPSTNGYTFTC